MIALADRLGSRVATESGTQLGRLRDMGARLAEPYPRVASLRVGDRRASRLVAWTDVRSFETDPIVVGAAPEEGGEEHDELLLKRDVLDAQIVDVAGRRVVRAADVELEARADGELWVAGVDVGSAALIRRLGLRRLAARRRPESLDWRDLHVASGRGHELALAVPASGVHRLRPSELAQVIAALPVARSTDLLERVEPERAARALAAARPGLGGRLVGALEPDVAGSIVAAMPVDDATAALRHLDRERLDGVLGAVPTERAAELRRLLAYPPDSAGGLMTPHVRWARAGEDARAIRERLGGDPPRLDGLLTVFVVDDERRVLGAIPPRRLLAGDVTPLPWPVMTSGAPVGEVVDAFALHDVLAVPVVDGDGRLVGAVAVDDVLEELLIDRLPGRRRFPTHVLRRRRREPA